MPDITRDHPLRWNGWRIAGWSVAVALLLVPLVAMQFSAEWQWDLFDFVVIGALLGSAGLALEWAVRSTGNSAFRWAAGLGVAGTFLLLWMNAAVGLIGGDQDRTNWLVPLVPLAGVGVAMFGRWRPPAMVRALLAMALAQVLIAATAVLAGWGATISNQPPKVLILSGFFTAVWLGSAWLFGRSCATKSAVG